MSRLGRALGPGRLFAEQRGRGPKRWILDWRDAKGVRRRQALSTDKRVAERIRANLIRERDLVLAGMLAEVGQSMDLAELRDLHLEDLATRSTSMHLRNVAGILAHALARIQAKRVIDLRPYDLIRYRGELVAKGLSNRTSNHHVARVQAMLVWGVKAGLIGRNPVPSLDRLPETERHKRYRRRALSDAEVERFLEAGAQDDRRCEPISRTAERPRVPQLPLWLALAFTGCRYGELRQLRWSDVSLEEGLLLVRAQHSKSGRPRSIPLHEELLDALQGLQEVHTRVHGREVQAGDHVFLTPEGAAWCRPSNNLNRLLRRVLEAAGIAREDEDGRKIDVHAMRHLFATRLARSRVGLVQAQRLLGHADPKLTAAVYSHVEVEDLRAAVASLPGTRRAS